MREARIVLERQRRDVEAAQELCTLISGQRAGHAECDSLVFASAFLLHLRLVLVDVVWAQIESGRYRRCEEEIVCRLKILHETLKVTRAKGTAFPSARGEEELEIG